MVCIKDTILEHVTIIESADKKEKIASNVLNKYKFVNTELSCNVLYFQLNATFIGHDVLFGCVYFPPEGSEYFDGNVFTTVENDLLYLGHEAFCLLGDFNARTALLADIDSNMYDEDDFILNRQNRVVLPCRKSDDSGTNNLGKKLIDFCKSANAFIVNGRFGCPVNSARCTSKDASVVDYAVMSLSLVENVQDFLVNDFCELLSDIHCPISLVLAFSENLHADNTNEDSRTDRDMSNVDKIAERPKWFKDSNNKFSSKLSNLDGEIENLNSALTDILASGITASQNQVDEICSKIGNVMKSTASDLGLYNRKNKKMRNRKTEACPWFDFQCEKKRKCFFRAKNKLKLNKNSRNMKEDLREKSKAYKKTTPPILSKISRKFYQKIKKS